MKLIDAHPAVGLSRGAVEVKQGESKLAGQYPNPEFEASFGQGSAHDGSDQALVWGLELSIPLEWAAKRHYASKAAKSSIDAAVHEAEAVRQEVILELKLQFIRIAYDKARLDSLEDFLEQLDSLVGILGLREEKGGSAAVELDRIEIQAMETRQRIEEAKVLAAVHRAQLDLWLGGKLPEDYEVDLEIAQLPELPGWEKAVFLLESGHPKIKAAKKNLEAASYDVKAQKHEAFPHIEVGGFYESGLDAYNYGAMLKITLPLWNWNLGAVAKSSAEKKVAAGELESTVTGLLAAFIEAHGLASQKREAALAYQSSIVPKAQKTAGILEKMYASGDAKLIDVLDGRRCLLETKMEYLSILQKFHAACAKLENLIGEVDDE
ncbi:MAG: TolC family protein [Pseudomonadota bacterium]